PQLPEQPAQRTTVRGKPETTALRVEVPLIPERTLPLGRKRLWRRDRVLDRVAADKDRSSHPIRVQRRSDAGGAIAPVVARHREARQRQRVGEVDEVLPDRRLL